ncbi:hypothetical protein LLH23_15075 [bacterium]|nr:hypothetical protein [bacterium]
MGLMGVSRDSNQPLRDKLFDAPDDTLIRFGQLVLLMGMKVDAVRQRQRAKLFRAVRRDSRGRLYHLGETRARLKMLAAAPGDVNDQIRYVIDHYEVPEHLLDPETIAAMPIFDEA